MLRLRRDHSRTTVGLLVSSRARRLLLHASLDRDGAIEPRLLGVTALPGKQILLGVIDLSNMTVESAETVAARIRRALPYVAAENIIVATDCGMNTSLAPSPTARCGRWWRAPTSSGVRSPGRPLGDEEPAPRCVAGRRERRRYGCTAWWRTVIVAARRAGDGDSRGCCRGRRRTLAWQGTDNADGLVGMANGSVLFAQEQPNRVRRIATDGMVSVLVENTHGAFAWRSTVLILILAVQRTSRIPAGGRCAPKPPPWGSSIHSRPGGHWRGLSEDSRSAASTISWSPATVTSISRPIVPIT